MDQYVLFVLLVIVVILIFRRSSSTYLPGTPQADYTPKFVSIGQDVTAASLTNPTYVLSQNAGDNLLGRLALNNFLWTNGGTGSVTINGTPVQLSTIWGVRKQLTIGGGGQVWYILNAPQMGGTDRIPRIIDTYVDSQSPPVTWAIPEFVLIQKSQVFPSLQCADNSTATDTGCVCNAGYYGTGDTLNTGGAALGCNLCPAGYYCPGGAVWTQCPTNANYSISGSVTSSACGLQCLTTANGGTQTAATTSSAAVCYCNPGTAFNVSQAPSSVYYQNSCLGCLAGYSLSGSSTTPTTCDACGSGYFQKDPNATSCPICAAGKSTQGVDSAATSCVDCLAGSVGPTDGTVNCTNCNSGSYVATAGQTQCQTCAGGNYSGPTGLQTQCTQCGAGTYSLTGASQCTNCGSGSWANPGATSCITWAGVSQLNAYAGTGGACLAGQYGLAGGGCGSCSSGQTSLPGSMGIAACYTPCAATGSKVTSAATTSSGAVCQCVAGYAGTGTTCTQCQLGSTFSSVDGAASCSAVTPTCSSASYVITTSATRIADNICGPFGPYTLTSVLVGANLVAANTSAAAATALNTLPNCTTSASTYYGSPNGMNGIWVWTAPFTRTYTFTVTGSPNGTGKPAVVTATCPINAGTYVYMIIGQTAASTGMGSGGTFVFIGTQTLFTSYTSLVNSGTVQTPLIAAGGCGGGGGGNASLTSSGASGPGGGAPAGGTSGSNGVSSSGGGGVGVLNLLSASGPVGSSVGGAGAGSGTWAGGGGGYSGGGGSIAFNSGGGGGSEVVPGNAVSGARGQAVKVSVTLATLATSTSSGYSLTNGSVVIS